MLRDDVRKLINVVKEQRLSVSPQQLKGISNVLKTQMKNDVGALHKYLEKLLNKEKTYFEHWETKKTKELIEQMEDATTAIHDYQRYSGKAIAMLLSNAAIALWIIAGVAVIGISLTAFAVYAFNVIKMGDYRTLKGICVLILSLSGFGFVGWLVAKLMINLRYWR